MAMFQRDFVEHEVPVETSGQSQSHRISMYEEGEGFGLASSQPGSAASSEVGSIASSRIVASAPSAAQHIIDRAPSPVTPDPSTSEPLPRCTICGDRTSETLIYIPCGHVLDPGCLRALFEHASRDESLFPPKCCQIPVPLAAARTHLAPELAAKFEARAREFRTPSRVYCARRACGAFIGPATEAAIGLRCTVPGCGAETCGRCKELAHASNKVCFNTAHGDAGVVAFAREHGWQRCPGLGCGYLVERTDGCPHMTCRCGRQFCYLCGAAWKTCGCP